MTESAPSVRDQAADELEHAAHTAASRSELNAFITLAPTAGGEGGPLHGWTVAVKDLIDVAGLPTTGGGSRTWVARRDATIVSRLRTAGARGLGKANMDEWGLGVTGRNAQWGDCRNPWDPTRICGGSSAGSAVAVAAGLATIGLGTDTAGSLRIPAALCGVTALKPGRVRMPMRGVLGLAPTLDCAGPMARSVTDCATAYGVMAACAARSDRAPRRVGIPAGAFWTGIADDVGRAVEAATRQLERSGARVSDVTLPSMEEATRLNGTVLLFELAHRHRRRWAGDRSRFDRRVVRQIELGDALQPREYESALGFRELWRSQLADVFATVDALIHPTTGRTAPTAEERVRTEDLTRFCAAWSFAGLPVLAIPVGFGGDGMPVGASLVGFDGAEATLLELGREFQRVTDWHEQLPPPEQ